MFFTSKLKSTSGDISVHYGNIDLDEFREFMASGKVVEGEMLKIFNILT